MRTIKMIKKLILKLRVISTAQDSDFLFLKNERHEVRHFCIKRSFALRERAVQIKNKNFFAREGLRLLKEFREPSMRIQKPRTRLHFPAGTHTKSHRTADFLAHENLGSIVLASVTAV